MSFSVRIFSSCDKMTNPMQLHEMTSAQSLLILSDRQQEWHQRLRLVREAQNLVVLSTYYIGCDRYGLELLSEIKKCLQRQVKVILVVDKFGQSLANNSIHSHSQSKQIRHWLKEVSKLGGEVVEYTTPSKISHWLGAGYHVKIQICDDHSAIFGSSNLSSFSFDQWQEFSVLFTGEIVKTFLNELNDINTTNTLSCSRTKQNSLEAISLEYFSYNPSHQFSFHHPFFNSKANPLTQRLIQLIESAEFSLDLVSLYFKPHESLLEALFQACQRGVKVRIFHSHRDSLQQSYLPWSAAYLGYKKLLQHGIEIYEQKQGQHAKVILADKTRCAFGSYNFEHWANDRLAEAMIFTQDSQIIEALNDYLVNILNQIGVEKITPQSLSKIEWQTRFVSYLCYPIRKFI